MQTEHDKLLVFLSSGDLNSRELLEGALKEYCQVDFVESFALLMEKLREYGSQISLVLLDLDASSLSDVKQLKELQAEASLPSVPLLVAASDMGKAEECLRLGAADYLPKPYPAPGLILFRVRGAIERGKNRGSVDFGDEASGKKEEKEAPPAEKSEKARAEEPETREGLSFFERARLYDADSMQQANASPAQENTPPSQGKTSFKLRTVTYVLLFLALAAAVALLVTDISVSQNFRRMKALSSRYIQAQVSAANMESSSDYLMERVRSFVYTGDASCMKDYIEEVELFKNREKALSDLNQLLEGDEGDAYAHLTAAMQLSAELEERERIAMRLMLEAQHAPEGEIPSMLAGIELEEEYLSLPPEEQQEKARSLVFDSTYLTYKSSIRESIRQCTENLIATSNLELEKTSSRMSLYLFLQILFTIIFLAIVILLLIFIDKYMCRPLAKMVELMRTKQTVPSAGSEELQFVSLTYNTILQEIRQTQDRLSHAASHDQLTGLFNRGAYEMMIKTVDTSHMALILVDVDRFKKVNETRGHEMGDKVLKRVAEILKNSFRSVDVISRIGGDEFVVIMTRANSTMRELVINKIKRANEMLQNPKDDLPPVSISVGVAFSDREKPQGDIFQDADTALQRVKKSGRADCEVF